MADGQASLNAVQSDAMASDTKELYRSRCRLMQKTTYELQTITGKISRDLSVGLVEEDSSRECCLLAGDAVGKASVLKALFLRIREDEPVHTWDKVEQGNWQLMCRKLVENLLLTIGVLQHFIRRLEMTLSSVDPEMQLTLEELNRELQNCCDSHLVDGAVMDASSEKSDDLDGFLNSFEGVMECVLLRDATVTQERCAQSKFAIVLPASTRVSVLEVCVEDGDSNQSCVVRGHICDVLGHVGFITLGRSTPGGAGFLPAVRVVGLCHGQGLGVPISSKNDIIETTQQLASHALSFVADNVRGVMSQGLMSTPDFSQHAYAPGEYILTRDAAVTEAPSFESRQVEVLSNGTLVQIEEVVTLLEEQRVRGRVTTPTSNIGYVTIMYGQYVFARQTDEDAQGSSQSNPVSHSERSRSTASSSKAKKDILEASQQFASHAAAFMSTSLPQLAKQFDTLTGTLVPSLQDADFRPGKYSLNQQAAVTSGPSFESQRVAMLPMGTDVEVLEIVPCIQDSRIRGRIKTAGAPDGFITIRFNDHSFATCKDEHDITII